NAGSVQDVQMVPRAVAVKPPGWAGHLSGVVIVQWQYAYRSVSGETMARRIVAIGLVLVCLLLAQGAELAATPLPSPEQEGTKAGARGEGKRVAGDAKDWPTYNCDVLGWRHNAGEPALSRANVARLEEKWRFPPKGAEFQIGVIHATPTIVNGYVYF